MPFPPPDLACPHPARCPVADPAVFVDAPSVTIEAGRGMARCYDGTWGYDEANPGWGDTRFAPFDATEPDEFGRQLRVPTLYLADNDVGAVLETVFHEVDEHGGYVYERDLARHLLVHVRTPVDLTLIDLRDPALRAMGLHRHAVVSSPAEHYPCTRRIARHLHRTGTDGFIWHSRQAEIHRSRRRRVPKSEVLVVFADRVSLPRGGWPRAVPGHHDLMSGKGKTLIDRLATEVGATVISDPSPG